MACVDVKLFHSYISLICLCLRVALTASPRFSASAAWCYDRVISDLKLSCGAWVLYVCFAIA